MSAALELLRAAQEGDRDACEQAVLENNGLIWSVVRRYYGRGVEPDDLYQLGCLGFLKAVKGFDFAYGTCFSTYAVPKIAGEIRRFLRDDGTIKVGRSVREQVLNALHPPGAAAAGAGAGAVAFRAGGADSAGHRRRSPRSIWLRKSRIPYSGKRRRDWRLRGSWGRKRRKMRWWSGSPCGKR